MADSSVDITAGAGTTIDTRTEATNGNHRQVVVLGDPSTNAGVAPVDATNGLAVDIKAAPNIFADDAAFTPGTSKVAVIAGQLDDSSTDSVDEGDAGALRMTPDRRLYTAAKFVTVSTDVTRPADTTAYAANDALSDSTSAPTSGGFTFSSAASKSGGSGIITDIWFCSSVATGGFSGELWIFDTSVTNINDNSAFAISDSEIKTVVAKVPFLTIADTNNAGCHVQNLSIGFTCVGSANLRFLYKVKAAYTPGNAEVITARLKILQID